MGWERCALMPANDGHASAHTCSEDDDDGDTNTNGLSETPAQPLTQPLSLYISLLLFWQSKPKSPVEDGSRDTAHHGMTLTTASLSPGSRS